MDSSTRSPPPCVQHCQFVLCNVSGISFTLSIRRVIILGMTDFQNMFFHSLNTSANYDHSHIIGKYDQEKNRKNTEEIDRNTEVQLENIL